jgi:hypothetical protein
MAIGLGGAIGRGGGVRTIGFGGGGAAGGASASTSSATSIGRVSDVEPAPSTIAATMPAWITTDVVTGIKVLSAVRFNISRVCASSVKN